MSQNAYIGFSDQADPGSLPAPGYLLLILTFLCVLNAPIRYTCGNAMVKQWLLDHQPCRTRTCGNHKGVRWGECSEYNIYTMIYIYMPYICHSETQNKVHMLYCVVTSVILALLSVFLHFIPWSWSHRSHLSPAHIRHSPSLTWYFVCVDVY